MVTLAFPISICALLAGCGRIGFDRVETDGSVTPVCGEVVPVYPAHAGWGQHVMRGVARSDDEHQPELDCGGTGLPCVHGGELRKLALPGITTCDGIVASDALDAFRWRCTVEGPTAVLYSSGLTRGLSPLVQVTGWRPNAVTVTHNGSPLCTSSATSWWQTAVSSLPLNAATAVVELATPDTVYVVDGSRITRGYVVTADRIGIVVLDGGTLSYDAGGAPNCNEITGHVAAADAHCVISIAGANFAWIEGGIDGRTAAPSLRGVQLRSTRSTHLVRLDVRATGASGVDIADAYDLRVADVDQQGASAAPGLDLDRVAWSRFERVRAANNATDGMNVHGEFMVSNLRTSSFNTFSEIVVAGNQNSGIVLGCGAHYNVVSQAIVAGNGGRGVLSPCNLGNVLAHVTSVSNGDDGVNINQNLSHRLSQIVVAGNNGDGLRIDQGSANNVIVNVASTDNEGSGVFLDAMDSRFDGFLVVGNNATSPCAVVGRGQPGLIPATCTTTGADGSNTYGSESSTAVLRTGHTAAGAFMGQVTTDDPISPFDVNGTAATVADWWAVSGRNRTWGNDGVFPLMGQRGPCGGSCRLWDWAAAPGGMLHEHSGNGVAANDPAEPGAPCPAAVAGDLVSTTADPQEIRGDSIGDDDGFCESSEECDPPALYLLNAVEVLGDGVGNDDALCNANEVCRYTPHLGASLTDAPATQTCRFSEGMVRGVTVLVP